ncbi:MAG: PTS sugar transporter subunit IIA [Pirellulales bacterium]|nr:PTS sugar transporter subunit IIA [Pirellulales bacterium]
MAESDFTIETLAAYLRLDPGDVVRMAERDRLPGRKVGGSWRFAPAEIHQWMERQIHHSTDAELMNMETVLQSPWPEAPDDAQPLLTTLLAPEAIALPLAARTRGAVIRGMVELAANTGHLWDPEKMTATVQQREELYPTALDQGVALLHPRRPMPSILAQPLLALGITPNGIPFGNPAGHMTDIFFLICSTDEREHLRTLARLCRLLCEPDFLGALRGCADPQAVRRLLDERERQLPV